MKNYRWSFWIFGSFSLVAVLLAGFLEFCVLTSNTVQFWINLLLGAFSSSLLVSLSSEVSYRIAREKCKAHANYALKEIDHILGRLNLRLEYIDKNILDASLPEIILGLYDISYQLGHIFVELSLDEVFSIEKGVVEKTQQLKESIEAFAKNLHNAPQKKKEIIQEYLCDVKFQISELRKYTDELKLISGSTNDTSDDKVLQRKKD